MRVTAIAAVLIALAAAPAAADEATDKAAAARLFQEGRDAMAAGKLEEACARFEASLTLDRAIGTKLNLADCQEKRGNFAAAYRLFDEAAIEGAKTGKEGREDFARQRATALVAKLVKLQIEFTGEVPSGTTVRIDGVDVPASAWKQPRYLMPGRYTIVVTAPGGEPIEVTASGTAGEAATAKVPALGGDDGGGTTGGGTTGGGGGAASPPRVDPPIDVVEIEPKKSRTLSYIVGGGGVALLGTSLALGFAARSKFQDAGCEDGVCPTQDAQDQADSARTLADVGTGFAIAGAVAVGVGVYLFVRAGSDRGSSDSLTIVPTVSDDSVGVVMSLRR
jgi:hypothetical protein